MKALRYFYLFCFVFLMTSSCKKNEPQYFLEITVVDGMWNDWKTFIQKTEDFTRQSNEKSDTNIISEGKENSSQQLKFGCTLEGNVYIAKAQGVFEYQAPKRLDTERQTTENKQMIKNEKGSSFTSIDLPNNQHLMASIIIRGDKNKSYYTIPKQHHSVTWNQRFILLFEDLTEHVTFELITVYKGKTFSAGTKSLAGINLYKNPGTMELKLSSGHLNIITRKVPMIKLPKLSKDISMENKNKISNLYKKSKNQSNQKKKTITNASPDIHSLSFTALLNQAENLRTQHLCRSAIDYYHAAIKKQQSSTAYSGLAWCEYESNRLALADIYFKKALQISHANDNALYGLGVNYSRMGKKNLAKQTFEIYLQRFPASPKAMDVRLALKSLIENNPTLQDGETHGRSGSLQESRLRARRARLEHQLRRRGVLVGPPRRRYNSRIIKFLKIYTNGK